jgi:protein-S-isoprenylcysteine O-methyltransferase Ste14
MTAAALNSDNITKIGLVIIVALVVIGALVSIVLTALVARIIILVVVVGLGIFVWQQRTQVKDDVEKCKLDATFFGVHISAPESVRQHCHPHG